VIEDDLLLIKDLEKLLSTYSEIGEKLNLKQAISTFERSLLEEVSLINEKNNIQQFRLNFKNNKKLTFLKSTKNSPTTIFFVWSLLTE
jgi:ubiquinone biosynthesis protein